jgi:septal ring factor EnvC (AmiA/AmiB activator)
MEVLTRKERELGVLRDSLEVEDDVGYISDDDDMSDGYDNAEPDQASSLGQYNSSQVEALATLMAQSESNSFDLGNAQVSNELEVMKKKLAEARTDHERNSKELKSGKESLANAKMIISALEMSNKSMMEDLRMRLQDSNSAITSLLAKSMESEKSTAMLRTQLEIVRKAGAEEKEKLRLEIETLQAAVAAAKGDGIISAEEKKDDAAC